MFERIKTVMCGLNIRKRCPKCDNVLEEVGINKNKWRCNECGWGA